MTRPGLKTLAALYAVALGLLFLWAGRTETLALRSQLAEWTPLALQASFLLLVGSIAAGRRAVARSLGNARFLLLFASVVAFLAVSFLPPATHRIFYDEDIYQNVAQNILWTGRAEMCNEATIEHGEFRCLAGEYNKEPNSFPFLVSLMFRSSGVDESSAHLLNRLLFALGAFVAGWAGFLLFGDRLAAAAASALYLLTPENLLWGATVAAEPGTATFAGLAVCGWLLFLREPSLATGLFAGSGLAFALQWRPEAGLLLPVVGIALLAARRAEEGPHPLADRRVYAAGLVALVLIVPHLAHLWAVRGEGWGATEAGKFAWQYVLPNLRTNAAFYVEGREFPLLYTVLAALGLAAGAGGRVKAVPAAWFLFMFAVFIPFHAGSYRYGADVRFSVVSNMPLAVLGGAGAVWVLRRLSGWGVDGRLARAALWVGLVYAFSAYLPLVRAVGREAWAARADHQAAREFIEGVPEHSVVLTHNPGMLQVMGQSAAQASLATYRPERVQEFFRMFPGGVYFHYNFWCNVSDPVQVAFCAAILERYPNQVLAEKSAGFNRFVLYRLSPPRARTTEPE
jgi:hypothetical protein